MGECSGLLVRWLGMTLPGLTPPRLVSAQFPIDHFTHIFIDEAGHCMEPESLVAIAGEGLRVGCGHATPCGVRKLPSLNLSPHATLPPRADGSQGNRQSRRTAGAGGRPSAAGACAAFPTDPEAWAGVLNAGAAAHLQHLVQEGPQWL